MARPREPLRNRILAKTEEVGNHLIWQGYLRNGKPYLSRIGNPARILLDLENYPTIQIKPTCLEPRCIEPTHWRVIKERSRYYDDRPEPDWRDPRPIKGDFSPADVQEIHELVEQINSGQMTVEELDEYPPPDHVLKEVLKRIK